MKRLSVLVTIMAILAGSAGYAQPTGKAAASGKNSADSFAWGPAIGGLAVIGIVVGITAASATNSTSSFSH